MNKFAKEVLKTAIHGAVEAFSGCAGALIAERIIAKREEVIVVAQPEKKAE